MSTNLEEYWIWNTHIQLEKFIRTSGICERSLPHTIWGCNVEGAKVDTGFCVVEGSVVVADIGTEERDEWGPVDGDVGEELSDCVGNSLGNFESTFARKFRRL
jgi:hypothetical protein